MIKRNFLAKRKLLLIAGFIASTSTFFACSDSYDEDSLTSVPEPSLKPYNNGNFATPVATASFKLKNVKYWVKDPACKSVSKCDSAMMVIEWADSDKDIPDAIVWGYAFPKDSPRTGADMITAITKKDPRLYLLSQENVTINTDTEEVIEGLSVGGIGFSLYKSKLKLLRSGNFPPYVPANNPKDSLLSADKWGFFTPRVPYAAIDSIEADTLWVYDDDLEEYVIGSITYDTTWVPDYYDYDLWSCPSCGPLAHWESGWYTNGYWAYDTTDSRNVSEFSFSWVGASDRVLQNGSYDAWIFASAEDGWVTPPFLPTFTPIKPPEDDDEQ